MTTTVPQALVPLGGPDQPLTQEQSQILQAIQTGMRNLAVHGRGADGDWSGTVESVPLGTLWIHPEWQKVLFITPEEVESARRAADIDTKPAPMYVASFINPQNTRQTLMIMDVDGLVTLQARAARPDGNIEVIVLPPTLDIHHLIANAFGRKTFTHKINPMEIGKAWGLIHQTMLAAQEVAKQRQLNSPPSITQKQFAAMMGISEYSLSVAIKMADQPEPIQRWVRLGVLTLDQLAELVRRSDLDNHIVAVCTYIVQRFVAGDPVRREEIRTLNPLQIGEQPAPPPIRAGRPGTIQLQAGYAWGTTHLILQSRQLLPIPSGDIDAVQALGITLANTHLILDALPDTLQEIPEVKSLLRLLERPAFQELIASYDQEDLPDE